jgi:signal transduction histidine kinase/DNA-binding response OmpR family regulator
VTTIATAQHKSWSVLTVVSAVLLFVLLAVALVQARQFSLVRQAFETQDDYSALAVYQVESEYLRLRDQWRMAADERQQLDADAVRLRYEIWVSRVELLENGRARRLFVLDAADQSALQQAMTFIATTDADLSAQGASPWPTLKHDFFAQRLAALRALEKPLHSMSLSAGHQVAVTADQRAAAVHAQSVLGLALTASLSVLTLGFAYLALRQVQKLRARRVALEEATHHLQQARKEAVAANEAKSTFLANMSHEIRTPFHGLMGMLSLLRETGLAPRQLEYLRTATESADHLLALLNDILDMSQLESGRMTLSPAPTDVRDMLREVEALMRPQASSKALALHIDAAPGVPEQVLMDATRVKQVLYNLLSNAIKFSDRGAVVLDVRTRERDGNGTSLDFVVTDTGQGMDEATQARLFNRFVQGDTSLQRRHGGSGLGLEISRNLARLMGGDITVRSKVGEGSTFTFRMPVVAVPTPLAKPSPTRTDNARTRPLHVLVAEDHEINRQYMAALLSSMGHQVHFAENGEDAVAALAKDDSPRFDLVLMDLHMPQMDGFAATRAIRALPSAACSTVPIVALTADAFEETRNRCVVTGMNGFLGKPVSPQELATVLRRLYGTPAAETVLPGYSGKPLLPSLPSEQAVLDHNAITVSLQAMTPQQFTALARTFLDQAPETVARLHAAVRDAQTLELRVNAHAAKGAAANLGFVGLAATAQALQQGAEHLPAHEIARLVRRFEDLLPITRQALQAMALYPAATPAVDANPAEAPA